MKALKKESIEKSVLNIPLTRFIKSHSLLRKAKSRLGFILYVKIRCFIEEGIKYFSDNDAMAGYLELCALIKNFSPTADSKKGGRIARPSEGHSEVDWSILSTMRTRHDFLGQIQLHRKCYGGL